MKDLRKQAVKNRPRMMGRTILKALVLAGGLAFFFISIAAEKQLSVEADNTASVDTPITVPAESAAVQDKNYSRFTHSNEFHSRLPCLLCHRRDDNSSRIGFPGKSGHLPCAGCHSLQFSDNTSPICTICHTDAQSGAMKRFPPLRSFSMRFNHARHSRVSCSVCHKPSQRGVALTIPSGVAAHNTCFSCHTSSSSQSLSSCNVCHQPGRFTRTPQTSRAYRVSFSHAKHQRQAGLTCSSCHSVRPGTARGRQVTEPSVSMHFATGSSLSCGACHDGKRAFGADDFANCKRCHTGDKFRF